MNFADNMFKILNYAMGELNILDLEDNEEIDVTELFEDNVPEWCKYGLCSAIYKDGLVGRNFDWLYSRMAECIVHTENTIGVAGGLEPFTAVFADSGIYHKTVYTLLPFFLNDGINKDGLFCCTLVTPNIVKRSIPMEEQTDSICSVMLVRYIIDNYTTVQEAVDGLKNHVEIWFPKTLLSMNYNQHWLICTKNEAVVLEVDSDGRVVTIPLTNGADRLSVTNFPLFNVALNDDGTVYTPFTQGSGKDAIVTNHIHESGSGLERFNVLQKSSISSVNDMKTLMSNLKYSQNYTLTSPADIWYTEFCDEENLTCVSSIDDFNTVRNPIVENYPNRSRDEEDTGNYGYWNTNHSAVYDLKNKKMYICSQENYNKWHELSI